MTTVAFGGGPTVEQRRGFAGIKDGSHIPGYRGYCPQLKYRVGKSFGQDTHELAEVFPYRQPMPPILPNSKSAEAYVPESTGDNRYSKKMVPGYTGYIPRMPFRYGGTYKEDCDSCLGEFFTTRGTQSGKLEDLRGTVRGTSQLKSLSGDPHIRDHLNTYRDTQLLDQDLIMASKRNPTEPPIPGYQGYVPRIYTTEQGLGCRYNQMTKNGLDMFKSEQDYRQVVQSAPVDLNRVPGGAPGPNYTRRLYQKDGMIPKYTGYVPQRRYNFGNTYGDTTRSLEVCAHPAVSFGDFMQTKDTLITKTLA